MRAASALIARGLRAASGDGSAAGNHATPGEATPAAPSPRGNATSGVVDRSELRYAAARKWQARAGARSSRAFGVHAWRDPALRAPSAASDAARSPGARAQQAEDRYLLEPDCAWQPAVAPGAAASPPVPFALFAVFDGHGGKAAAEACVAHVLPELLAALVRARRGARRALRFAASVSLAPTR